MAQLGVKVVLDDASENVETVGLGHHSARRASFVGGFREHAPVFVVVIVNIHGNRRRCHVNIIHAQERGSQRGGKGARVEQRRAM